MRVTADTADRPGHCATVVRSGERGDKRGEEGGDRSVEEMGSQNNVHIHSCYMNIQKNRLERMCVL